MKSMEFKGFFARVMEAERLFGDMAFGLPPGRPLDVYCSDFFVKWPENWMRGPGVFLVPVRPNKGLWFDWTQCDANNTAVLPTIKGCNPLTGMPTSGFHLERYETKCPKHGIDFLAERFCPECSYKWKPQNYIAAPNTLWWDTWASSDGIGRQFFFTEDEMRDVAQALIGKENTVPAFGFAFYRPKVLRESPKQVSRGIYYESYGSADIKMKSFDPSIHHVYLSHSGSQTALYSAQNNTDGPVACAAGASAASSSFDSELLSESKTHSTFTASLDSMSVGLKSLPNVMRCAKKVSRSLENSPAKEVSIGAGAKINQDLMLDPYALDTWKDAPEAVMTIYFVFQDKFEELRSGGMRDLNGQKEGMLAGVPIG